MSVGEKLKCARIERKLSISDVTDKTKIQPWVLEALEGNRLHEMMSPIYAKGFLTTYAKILHLEPESLISELVWPKTQADDEVSQPLLPGESFSFRILEEIRGRLFKPWIVLVLASVAVIIVNPLRLIPSFSLPHRQASVAGVTVSSVTSPSMESIKLDVTQPLELTMTVRGTTWVRVRADGKLLTQQRLLRGAQELWSAKEQLELIVAKPSQVDLTLNGQSIGPLAIANRGRLLITRQGIGKLPEEEVAGP